MRQLRVKLQKAIESEAMLRARCDEVEVRGTARKKGKQLIIYFIVIQASNINLSADVQEISRKMEDSRVALPTLLASHSSAWLEEEQTPSVRSMQHRTANSYLLALNPRAPCLLFPCPESLGSLFCFLIPSEGRGKPQSYFDAPVPPSVISIYSRAYCWYCSSVVTSEWCIGRWQWAMPMCAP